MASRPDLAAVILNDLPDNGKSDAAPALTGRPGLVRPVETVKDIDQVLCLDSFSVVLDLHLDEVSCIQHPKLDAAHGLVHIFDTVVHNVVDDPLDLLRIGNDARIPGDIHLIGKRDVLLLQVYGQLLCTVVKEIHHIQPRKIVGDPVRIDLGIERQLIDQPVHVIGLIVDRADVAVHFLRRVRHAVHDSFHISLDRGDRRLQVVRDIADQFPVFLVEALPLLLRFLQTAAHGFKVPGQLADLILPFRMKREVQVSLCNPLCGFLQIVKRRVDPLVDPHDKACGRYSQDQDHTQDHLRHDDADLRHDRLCGCHDECASPGAVRKLDIQLLDNGLVPSADVDAFSGLLPFVIIRKRLYQVALIFPDSLIIDFVLPDEQQVGQLVLQHVIQFLQIGKVQEPVRIIH